MVANVLRDIGGVGIYGVISICLFFTVFSGAIVWTLLQKKSFVTKMGALPLQEEALLEKGDVRHE